MSKFFPVLVLVSLLFVITGCAQREVHPDRVGCTFIDGEGRYGLMLTNYIKGDAKGVYVYVGENATGTTITCNADTQEITVIKE